MLPQSEMKEIMSNLLTEEQDSWKKYLNYGANAGDGKFTSALRSFLQRRTADDDLGGGASSATDLFITTGVSHGLELLCSTCTNPGEEVWIERPTYFLSTQIFTSNGLIVNSLPMSSPGKIDVDRLITMIERDGVEPPKMIYIIPSYHNPTGLSMSVEERQKLASFAFRNDVLLVCDEVYHLLDFELDNNAKPFPRPAGMARFNPPVQSTDNDGEETNNQQKGCCISVSSFTKIFAPGVRLGWIEAPPYIIQRLSRHGYIDSQGGNSPFMGNMMRHCIELGLLDSYLDKLRIDYKERYELVCKILQKEPRLKVLTMNEPRAGGYFIWVQLPTNVNADEFLSFSIEQYGVRFMAGTKTNPLPDYDDDIGNMIISSARLCFVDLDRDELEKGTNAFVTAFQSYSPSLKH